MATPLSPPPHPRRRLHSAPDPAAAAAACADELDRLIRGTGRSGSPKLSIAFSGGTTPATMFRALAQRITESDTTAAGWARTHVLQVDERIVPDGDPQRNANDLTALLLDPTNVAPDHRHLMPVTRTDAVQRYERTLTRIAPEGLDVIVLGLGDDGHTASLVPGDPVLDLIVEPVATTGIYRGTRRLTLTRASLDAARIILWLVTGAAKADPLRRLLENDTSIPAGLVRASEQIIFADRAAAALVLEPTDPPEPTSPRNRTSPFEPTDPLNRLDPPEPASPSEPADR